MGFNLAWGEPVVVREVLDKYYNPLISQIDVVSLSYPPYRVDTELALLLQKITGYKHIIITTGATGAINTVLRVLKKEGRTECITTEPHFPFYPDIIKKCGMNHQNKLTSDNLPPYKKVRLVDVPSNPWGHIRNVTDTDNNVVWDSVYANPVYINTQVGLSVEHRVNINSLSKWLGLTGLRIGWIGTNNTEDFKLFYDDVLYETCGVSTLGQSLALDILKKVDLDSFGKEANTRINMNRDEFQKLGGFFDNQEIPINGMFYPVWVKDKAIEIVTRAGVDFITLKAVGSDSLIRFNLAQNNKITKDAIKAIKTADRLRNKV
jgi:aspartate/methionine/tyrosine aminotransferase